MDFSKLSEADRALILNKEANKKESSNSFKFYNKDGSKKPYSAHLVYNCIVGCQNYNETTSKEHSNKVSWLQLFNFHVVRLGYGDYNESFYFRGEKIDGISIPFHCRLDDDGMSYLFDFASASKNKDESIEVVINKSHFSVTGIKVANCLSQVVGCICDKLASLLADENNNITK